MHVQMPILYYTPCVPFLWDIIFFSSSKKQYHISIIRDNLTLYFSFYLNGTIYNHSNIQESF